MPSRRAHLYAFVHPLFWPWLWFQLWRLDTWQRAAQRDVLFRIDRRGNLYINAIGDAPRDPALYHYDAPRIPAWAAPALACDLPDNITPECLRPCAQQRAAQGPHVFPRAPLAPDTS